MKVRTKQIARCADALERIADVMEAARAYMNKADEDLKALGRRLCTCEESNNDGTCIHCYGTKGHPRHVVSQEGVELQFIKEQEEMAEAAHDAYLMADDPPLDQVEGVDIGIKCPNCDWSKVHPVMDHGGPVGILQCDNCGHCFDDPRPDSPLFPPEVHEGREGP